MHPRYITQLEAWFKVENDKKHSMAVNYIEENIDLVDTDLQKFLDDCPSECVQEVYDMLQEAGIDMKDYVITSSLKQWEKYIRDTNNYYTTDYKYEMKRIIDAWE